MAQQQNPNINEMIRSNTMCKFYNGDPPYMTVCCGKCGNSETSRTVELFNRMYKGIFRPDSELSCFIVALNDRDMCIFLSQLIYSALYPKYMLWKSTHIVSDGMLIHMAMTHCSKCKLTQTVWTTNVI